MSQYRRQFVCQGNNESVQEVRPDPDPTVGVCPKLSTFSVGYRDVTRRTWCLVFQPCRIKDDWLR